MTRKLTKDPGPFVSDGNCYPIPICWIGSAKTKGIFKNCPGSSSLQRCTTAFSRGYSERGALKNALHAILPSNFSSTRISHPSHEESAIRKCSLGPLKEFFAAVEWLLAARPFCRPLRVRCRSSSMGGDEGAAPHPCWYNSSA